MRTWTAVLGALAGLMLIPAVRRRAVSGLFAMPVAQNLAVRSLMNGRWVRSRVSGLRFRPFQRMR